MEVDRIIQGDCLEIMKDMPDRCVDAVITDPPYGLGIDEWDKPQPVSEFMDAVDRVLSDDGFFAFFGQMPKMLEWLNEAGERFKYKEH